MTKLVVGLGNIGEKYKNTNHNMGFMVLDKVAKELGFTFKKNMCSSTVAQINVEGQTIVFAKPSTYMNNSGEAVKSLCAKFGVDKSKDLLIISDDIDLSPSQIRIRQKGSAGSHNGLKSIVEHLGTTDFNRLRVGVGRPDKQLIIDFVLANAKLDESLNEGLDKAKEAVIMFAKGNDISNIMQKFN